MSTDLTLNHTRCQTQCRKPLPQLEASAPNTVTKKDCLYLQPAYGSKPIAQTATVDMIETVLESPEGVIRAPGATAPIPDETRCFRVDSFIIAQQQGMPARHLWYALDETETDGNTDARKRASYGQ